MAGDETLRVLIVCAANQCRSRAAEIVLATALANEPSIGVSSAGVDVQMPMPLCPKAEKFLLQNGFDVSGFADRPARPLTPEALATADLVLVADKSVRAAVVAMAPNSRTKTFSLRGAGSAAQYINTNDLIARARTAHQAGQTEVVEQIDGEPVTVCEALGDGTEVAVRWLRTELEAAQGHAAPKGGHDILDAHVVMSARHSKALTDVLEAASPLTALLRNLSTVNQI